MINSLKASQVPLKLFSLNENSKEGSRNQVILKDKTFKTSFEKTFSYSFEELVAELGSAFVGADLGVSGDVQHECYIASWLTKLNNDKRFIFKAASLASKAHKFLFETLEEEKQEAA